MSHHISVFKIKKQILRWKSKGLSLIEVLIVMVITGFTLVALLNLAARDLSIEKINEQSDLGNYVSFSQLQEFDNIKQLNPSCISTIAGLYSSSNGYNNTYFVCRSGTLTNLGSLVSACNNYSATSNGTFYVYEATAAPYINGYLDVAPTGNGTYDCDPSQSVDQSNGEYGERLLVTSFTAGGGNAVNNVDIKSQTQWFLSTNKLKQLELLEEYSF